MVHVVMSSVCFVEERVTAADDHLLMKKLEPVRDITWIFFRFSGLDLRLLLAGVRLVLEQEETFKRYYM